MFKTINDINKAFTQVIAEYMAKGMVVNTQTMSGTQGEKAKIDLTDGNGIYRIMVADGYEDDVDGRHHYEWLETREITVERFETDNFGTLWNGSGEVIFKKVFYKINRREIFTDSIEEIREITKKQMDRYSNRHDYKEVKVIAVTKMADKEMLRDICQQSKGYKSVRRVQVANLIKETRKNEIVYKVDFVEKANRDSLIIKRIRKEA